MLYRGGLCDAVLVVSVKYKPVARENVHMLVVMVVVVVLTDIGGSAAMLVAVKHHNLRFVDIID